MKTPLSFARRAHEKYWVCFGWMVWPIKYLSIKIYFWFLFVIRCIFTQCFNMHTIDFYVKLQELNYSTTCLRSMRILEYLAHYERQFSYELRVFARGKYDLEKNKTLQQIFIPTHIARKLRNECSNITHLNAYYSVRLF